jgi:hypothetical protein
LPSKPKGEQQEKKTKKKDKLDGSKAGLLLHERINAKVFQSRLKK